MYIKNCPRCNIIIKYKRKNALIWAIKYDTTCQDCKAYSSIPYESNKKWCNTCKTNKPFSDFNKNKSCKNGLQSNCKLCGRAKNKKYRQENHEEEIARSKKYRKEYPEKIKESLKKYRNKNRNKLLEYDKEYRHNNKNKIYKKQQEYRKDNLDKDRAKSRKRRAKKAEVNENFTIGLEMITYKAFNDKCFNCGAAKTLGIDHHRPLSKGNPLTLYNATVLCRSCNSSKGDKDPEIFYGTKICNLIDKKLQKLAQKYLNIKY